MIKYLIDASAICEFYRPKATFHSYDDCRRSLSLKKHITQQKITNKAIIFIPSFCVAGVCNTLAKWHLRNGILTEPQYKTFFYTFISDVHDRKFFYSCDLNRYHNINTTEVTNIEHSTHTEFDVTGLPIGTDKDTLNEKLKENDPRDHCGKYYLSTFDVLIIAMGMELKRIHGTEIHLLTKDKRLALISSKKPDIFPKPYYWPELKVSDLPHS
ncbi:hypothetical protein LR007_00290 [candidate division NPL-UPA2 bacterium]|nr:hypothetical protein [candidate division NPL-UPA2 bacterium]